MRQAWTHEKPGCGILTLDRDLQAKWYKAWFSDGPSRADDHTDDRWRKGTARVNKDVAIDASTRLTSRHPSGNPRLEYELNLRCWACPCYPGLRWITGALFFHTLSHPGRFSQAVLAPVDAWKKCVEFHMLR